MTKFMPRNLCAADHSLDTHGIFEPSTSYKWKSKAEQPEQPSKRRQTITASQEGPHSFATLCSNFLSLPIEDRLQFLSWLFEDALSRCISDCERNPNVPLSNEAQVPNQNGSHGTAKKPDERISRKRMPWSPEEKNLLVQLRREQQLTWSRVTRLFSEQFGGRSLGSIQVYWYTYLKDM